jgi:hypothetical protein
VARDMHRWVEVERKRENDGRENVDIFSSIGLT